MREYTRILASVRKAAAPFDAALAGTAPPSGVGDGIRPASGTPAASVMWREFGKLLGAEAINSTRGMPVRRPDRSRRAW